MLDNKKIKLFLTLIGTFLFFIFIVFIFSKPANEKDELDFKKDVTVTPVYKQYDQPPPLLIDKSRQYRAQIETDMGEITVDLFSDQTPVTVNNFIFLAKEGFYDNTIFHRVIDGFMIQGGDPKGDGTGGPGYKFDDESFSGEYTRGTIAMANSGPNTNGSQFFIMQKDNLKLPKNYVIFGKVSQGMDIVDKIAQDEVEENAMGELSKPKIPTIITAIIIIEE